MRSIQEPASLPLTHHELTLVRLRRSLRLSVRDVPAGGLLVLEDHPLPAAVVVESGLFAVAATAPSGKLALLMLLRPGDGLVPEGLSMRWAPGPAGVLPDIRAVVDSRGLLVSPVDLAEAASRDPAIERWLLAAMARGIHTALRSLTRALALPVRDRVLDLLCELAQSHGEQTSIGVRLSIPLAQEDIGAMVGATRESVNRALRQLVRAGLVRRWGLSYFVARAALRGDPTEPPNRSPGSRPLPPAGSGGGPSGSDERQEEERGVS